MNTTPASLWRRLAAILYDSILVLALWLMATLALLPFTNGDAIAPGNIAYQVYLLVICFSFFAYCWIRRRQTPGMLAWRIMIQNKTGDPITFVQAVIRFSLAIPSLGLFGLGLLWMLVDKKKLALHDRYSKTYLTSTQQ